jgi:two-component system phosphate regulon response regulator PhoB
VSRQKKRKAQTPRVLTVDGLSLNLKTRELQNGHGAIHLTPKECKLLATFMCHPNQVLSHRFLMREVWETEYIGDTRTLQVHVSWLRRKIEENPRRPTRLRTVRGVGYRFGAQLES